MKQPDFSYNSPNRHGVAFATQSPFIPAPSEQRPDQPTDNLYLPDGMMTVRTVKPMAHESKLMSNEKLAKLSQKMRPTDATI